jgi:hypothetical protein
MSRQQTATLQAVLAMLESLPESQQDDLMKILPRRRPERRRGLLAARIQAARAKYTRGEATQGTVDELMLWSK